MRRGRKPKPRALRILEGNPGKRRLPPDIRVGGGDPTMPRFLSGAAKTEWRRVIDELRRLGLCTMLDRAALAGYCQSWARWVEAEEQVKKYGDIVKSPTGFPMQSPFLIIANQALKQMRKFALEFGMTPSSRSRVETDRPPLPSTTPTRPGAEVKDPGRFFKAAT